MKENYLYWIWLNEIKGIGPIIARRLIDNFHFPENIYDAPKEMLLSIQGVGESLAENIVRSKSLEKANSILDKCERDKIRIINYKDEKFPYSLNNYSNMPILLYYKGSLWNNLESVAIVGSRRCTNYGKQITVEAATYLARNGIPVISGMAKGIDSYAHTACIKAAGNTVAFLGCGVDICYPKEHAGLMEQIIANGAVVSEYPPGTMPSTHNFPRRNRLISACSKKVLIVEAGENSGALITAKYAREQNKQIYAVPNNVYLKESKGTNKLIAEGAKIYLTPKQLLIENNNINYSSNHIIEQSFGKMEYEIFNIIRNKPSTIDEIIIILNKDISLLFDILLSMELEGKIYQKANRYFLKSK
ncbi:DNA-processing protein DprA [Clostridium sp. C8]|jgi:DNA processing protein|uniref:Helix-hairpin-helix DNA-binding motif class 1 domain-containing protein n=2 Tax=root TaxID=1 RepID=A0A645BPX5_9ZZZZ|nr:DNA-processing protein DprA [Clostridium sp. C8]KLE15670.1 hypothetical protein AAT22_10135 [Clostridium sp. C8]